jgi:hydroxyacylglutathione hydrolase
MLSAVERASMEVAVVPYRADNYAYLLWRRGSKAAVVVDAGEAAPVLSAARERGLSLAAVLSTHHHGDHVGGNAALRRALPELQVFGPARDGAPIPALTRAAQPATVIAVAELELSVIAAPGHTRGALVYAGHGWVFTGDTLFGAGCGRLFEGTAAELHASLMRLVHTLPADTQIGCGREVCRRPRRRWATSS